MVKSAGYAWLVKEYHLQVLEPFQQSYIHERSDRRSCEENGQIESYFPKAYDPGDDWTGNLTFAFKYEGVNLEVLAALLPKIPSAEMEDFVRLSPIGKYARFAWYFYELLANQKLGLANLDRGNYLPILDEELEYALSQESAPRAKRQRLIINLLGEKEYCPRIRKTKAIREYQMADIAASVRALIASYPSHLIDRASKYLYSKETKSSFEIEREHADTRRTARFIELLRRAGRGDSYGEPELTALQNAIVEERYEAKGFRSSQNYVGESIGPTREIVHYIPPKPEDLHAMMDGWAISCKQIHACALDALVHAAIAGFGFVFLHPFDDGNGRIHRFLIHDALVLANFTPSGMIFPVSAVMLRRMKEYDSALEAFSRPLMEHLRYRLSENGALSVDDDTARYYRYPDLTRQAEALASFIQETADTEFSAELQYLESFDRAREAVRSILDMPDRKLDLFIRLVMQGRGKLSAAKRGSFSEISDEELSRLESAVAEICCMK